MNRSAEAAPTTVRIVLQARTDSTRLPSKALRTIAGMPSAVLAAMRASNRGHDLVLATTDRSLDDVLVERMTAAGIRVFRGATHDVRARFLAATSDLDDRAVVVRLTADNVVPDGSYVAAVVAALIDHGLDYLEPSSEVDGVPHGLAAEAFRLGELRRVVGACDDPYEREHVTPALSRTVPRDPAQLVPGITGVFSAGHERCTLDTEEDLDRLLKLFDTVTDPVGISWRELVRRIQVAAAPVRQSPNQNVTGDATHRR